MRLRIGGTLLDNNTATFTRRATAVMNTRKIPVALRWEWRVTVLFASYETTASARQLDFSRQEFQLRSLLSFRNKEYAFHADNGVPTDAVLSPLGSLSGTDVITIGNPVEGRGEYSGLRTMDFVAAATYPIGDPTGVVMSFRESLRFQGTGMPKWEETVGILGGITRQIVEPATPCFAIQSGSAMGFTAYPSYGSLYGAPMPMWPEYCKGWENQYSYGEPEYEGDTPVNWPISWSFNHVRIGRPFGGTPTIWR